MIRNRSKPFRALLAVLGVGFVVYLGFRWTMSTRLGREVERWQQAGAAVVVADLCPVDGSSVESDPDNGAALYREAINSMTTDDFTGNSTAFIKQLANDPVAGPSNEAAIVAAREYLADRHAAIALVLAAAAKPKTQFDFNWQAAMSGMSDRNHLLGLMHWCRVLRARVHVALHEGRGADAVGDLETGLRMADALAQEPRLDAYLVRAGILRSVAAAATRVANRADLSAPTSRRLAAAFEDSLAATDLATALHGERCLGSARYLVPIGRLAALRDQPSQLNPFWTLPGFGDLMELKLLQYYDVMRDYEAAAQAFKGNRLQRDDNGTPGDFQLPSLRLLHREQAELIAALELARYGLLLNAELLEGKSPSSLRDFVGGGELSLIDPCADGAIEYGFLANASEYRIYSVGRNQIDEGGTEEYYVDGLREFRGGDVTFIRRLPAVR